MLFDLQIFWGGVHPPSATSRTISFSISNSFWYHLYACCANKFRSTGTEGFSTKLIFFASLVFCEFICPPLAISYWLPSLFTAWQMPFKFLWRCRQTRKVSAWLHFAIERHFELKDDCLRYHPSNEKLYPEVSKGGLVSRGSIYFLFWFITIKKSRMFLPKIAWRLAEIWYGPVQPWKKFRIALFLFFFRQWRKIG